MLFMVKWHRGHVLGSQKHQIDKACVYFSLEFIYL